MVIVLRLNSPPIHEHFHTPIQMHPRLPQIIPLAINITQVIMQQNKDGNLASKSKGRQEHLLDQP